MYLFEMGFLGLLKNQNMHGALASPWFGMPVVTTGALKVW